ncbi:MAG: porin [Burkholderiaceae bacterium]
MKQTILALAVLGAFTSTAQAQVTIGGVFQANVKDYKIGNLNNNSVASGGRGPTAVAPANELRIDDDYNSRFWLTGTEDLGGGTSALFYVENRFDTDTGPGIGSGISAGDTFFGLRGAFGQATIGRHSLYYAQGYATETIIGNGGITAMPSSMWATFTFMDYVGATPISISRVPNSIKYTTPNMGGFTGSVGYSTSNSTEGTYAAGNASYSKGQVVVLTGNYTNGPIYTNLAYWQNDTEGRPTTITAGAASNADTRAIRFSGSYKMPFGLKVGLQLDRSTLKAVGQTPTVSGADQSRTVWELPASYAFGNSTILGSYSKAGSISGTTSTGAKMFTLGYDYSLSKRTNLGVYFSKLKNDAVDPAVAGSGGVYQPFLAGFLTGSALVAGESASTFAFGIKHTF